MNSGLDPIDDQVCQKGIGQALLAEREHCARACDYVQTISATEKAGLCLRIL
jgi:hypothetical protein